MNSNLLIVTDLGVLKAYKLNITPRGSPRLERLETVVLDEAQQQQAERVTDPDGRHAAPTHISWTAPEADAHILTLESRRQLIKKIAGHMERLIQENTGCGVRFAAHHDINLLILSSLRQPVRQRIEANLALDLVHAEERELIKCFVPEMLACSRKNYERLESH